MKRAEFVECCKTATNHEVELPSYLSVEVVEMFESLERNLRVVASKNTFAAAIRGQAVTFTGEIVQSELEALEGLSRRVDLI